MKASYYEGNKTFTVKEKELIAPAKGEVRIRSLIVVYVEVMFTSFMVIWIAVFLSLRLSSHEMSGVLDAIGKV